MGRDADAIDLERRGFVVIPGPVAPGRLGALSDAYEAAMKSATGDDIKIGSTSTRVSDFVNRGPEFDELYIFPPLLEACRRVIGRTVRPHEPAQQLHVDVRRDSADYPLLGFILMVDDFRPDNGATRFVPSSHIWSTYPEEVIPDPRAEFCGQELACGNAGSLLIFNGSTWHSHTANTSNRARRSLQGFFVPRDGRAATNFAARMQPETRARLGPLAKSVLAL